MNSVKMKLSVILGVIHMTIGICLKGVNSRYFYNSLDFFFEFIPQLILLTVTFGYMNLLIIIKWNTHYSDTADAPSIISMMIDMMLGYGEVKETPLIGGKETHENINRLILVLAFFCIPAMLLVKPIVLIRDMKKHENSKKPGAIELGVCSFKKRRMSDHSNDEELKSDSDGESAELIKRTPQADGIRRRFGNDDERRSEKYDPEDDPYSINDEKKKDEVREKLVNASKMYMPSGNHGAQEIWIHQLIETIEFVLGTISNTASYLRLWALSLAHSQLAEVFYDKLLESSVEKGQWISIFIVLPMFISANFFILVCMDSME